MKSYHQLSHELSEAKIDDLRDRAEQLRLKGIALLQKALKDNPEISSGVKTLLKDRLRLYKSRDYSNATKKMIDDHMSSMERMPEWTRADIRDGKAEFVRQKKAKEILDNPVTICDILSDPTPNRFMTLIKGNAKEVLGLSYEDADPRWVKELDAISDEFQTWFESQGGSKRNMVTKFTDMVSCKNRAPWASYDGKAYRGVARSIGRIKNYNFINKVKQEGSTTWLIAKGSYKSRYGAQSWTDNWKIAVDFALRGGNIAGHNDPVGIVFEVDLKPKDTLLSPDVISKVSGYKEEREVIRVSDTPLPVTIYVNMKSIKMWLVHVTPRINENDTRGTLRKKWLDKMVVLFGVKTTDSLIAIPEFNKMLNDLVAERRRS
jgi:hypothetical protein